MTETPPVTLRAVAGERTWDFALRDPQDEVVIGRGSGAGFRIDEPLISRRHLALSWRDGVLLAADLGSRNGSRLNGAPLRAPMRLTHGDRLEIGPVTLTVSLPGPEARTVLLAATERSEATRVARGPARRWRRWVPLAAAVPLCLALTAVRPGPVRRPAPRAPRAAGSPEPAPASAPAEESADVPTGSLRRDAILALAEGRREDARRLFERLAARLPEDRVIAIVLARTRP